MSTIKSNLKFVIGTNRGTKLATKTIGSNTPDFSSTINISTNSRIKEKFTTKKTLETKQKVYEKQNDLVSNATNATISLFNLNSINAMSSPNHNPIRRVEDKEKREKIENNLNLKDSRTLNKEKSKENYGSNNSNRSLKNATKEEKVKPRHQKHASEIPLSFKSIPHFSENYFYNPITNNNLLDIYTPSTNPDYKEREVFEKSTLNPKMLKIKSQRLFDNNNRSSRGLSKNSHLDLSKGTNKPDNSIIKKTNIKMNLTVDNYNEESNNKLSGDNTKNNNNDNNNNYNDDDLKYKALLFKYRNQEKSMKCYMRTIDILKNYIESTESVTEKMKYEIADKINKKSLEVKKLVEENSAIKKENKELKQCMLNIIYGIKLFDSMESKRESEYNKMYSQILIENEYLRYASERVVGSFNPTVNALSYYNEDISDPYTNEQEQVNAKQKGLHKRQKTHINFNHIQSNNENTTNTGSNNDSIINESDGSTNTVVETKEDDDIFNKALTSMNLSNTMKRSTNITTTSNEGVMSPKVSNAGGKGKPVYLFYRTPSNKDNKKIEFTKKDEVN